MSKVPSDFGEWSEAAKYHFTKNMGSSLENWKKLKSFEKIWKIRKTSRKYKKKIVKFEKVVN